MQFKRFHAVDSLYKKFEKHGLQIEKNSDGTFVYSCYNNGELDGVRTSLYNSVIYKVETFKNGELDGEYYKRTLNYFIYRMYKGGKLNNMCLDYKYNKYIILYEYKMGKLLKTARFDKFKDSYKITLKRKILTYNKYYEKTHTKYIISKNLDINHAYINNNIFKYYKTNSKLILLYGFNKKRKYFGIGLIYDLNQEVLLKMCIFPEE